MLFVHIKSSAAHAICDRLNQDDCMLEVMREDNVPIDETAFHKSVKRLRDCCQRITQRKAYALLLGTKADYWVFCEAIEGSVFFMAVGDAINQGLVTKCAAEAAYKAVCDVVDQLRDAGLTCQYPSRAF